jgi:hypothetical protein
MSPARPRVREFTPAVRLRSGKLKFELGTFVAN